VSILACRFADIICAPALSSRYISHPLIVETGGFLCAYDMDVVDD
jgi:hypothetical protein